jgi:ABC-2 type transport system permease protein
MHFALDVPIFGPVYWVALTIALLVAVALGIGFVVSLLARSEQQASQVAMLVLLAAVFFSGLVVSLDRIMWPMRAISFALPSTYAIRTTQDVMLRGVLRHPEDLLILGGAAVALYVLTWFLLRRELRPS